MSHRVSEHFLALPDAGWPARHAADLMGFAQGERLFHLSAAKQSRDRSLKKHFRGRRLDRIFLSANLASFQHESCAYSVEPLPTAWLRQPGVVPADHEIEALRNAAVIVNNNDIAPGNGASAYAELVARCPYTIFLAWDWDNHHWLDQSTMLAALSDLYCPSHQENLYLLTRFNPQTIGPVYCGSVQWSRQFLSEQLPLLLTVKRSDSPLGMHIPYGGFEYRNRVVGTLSRHFSSVGFSDRRFHNRPPLDRLNEWAAHKAHWIVPVLNDVPIRIFDALISGGIPIIPMSLRHLPPVAGLDERDVVFYGPLDIVEPTDVANRANALFDAGGHDRLVARHRLALDLHHGDTRITQMLQVMQCEFGLAA